MPIEQPESSGGVPSLDPVLRIVGDYAGIARKLEEDIRLLTGFLQEQGGCSAEGDSTIFRFPGIAEDNNIGNMSQEESWSVDGYTLNDGDLWYYISNSEDSIRGFVPAERVTIFGTDCIGIPEVYSLLDFLLREIGNFGIILDVDDSKEVRQRLQNILFRLYKFEIRFEEPEPVTLQALEDIVRILESLREYGVEVTTPSGYDLGWKFIEIESIYSIVITGIGNLLIFMRNFGTGATEENARTAFLAIFGQGDTNQIIFRREYYYDDYAGLNSQLYLTIYNCAFAPEDCYDNLRFDAISLILHEIAHNTTWKFYSGTDAIFPFEGQITINTANCEELSSAARESLSQYYEDNMAKRYIVNRYHRVNCSGLTAGTVPEPLDYDPNTGILSISPLEEFNFREFSGSDYEAVRLGLLAPVASEEKGAEWLADALMAFLANAYDDNNSNCYTRLAASIRREQGEILIQSLLEYYEFLDSQGCGEAPNAPGI